MTASTSITRPEAAPSRRGMMLLVVLSLLSLFLMLGTLMLVNTSRAKTSAQAFAAATASNASSTTVSRRLLDEALMKLITAPAGTPGLTESLLADKYGSGTAIKGRMLSLVDNGPLLTGTLAVTLTGSSKPFELNGRVVTLVPKVGERGDITSFRILRTTGSTSPYTCQLANLRLGRPVSLPPGACDVIVNGPEFRTEAYDAYDSDNAWLTQVELENSRVKRVPRPAFGSGTATPEVDNDGDGIADGVWLANLFDDMPTSDGGRLSFKVSYLVLDMDGRINVNAHGTTTSLDYPTSAWNNSPDVTIGGGYGPADIDASRLFVGTTSTNAWSQLVRGAKALGSNTPISSSAASATQEQRRPTPTVGSFVGRYGSAGTSGTAGPGDGGNDALSAIGDQIWASNRTVDLASRFKVWIDTSGTASGTAPTLTYFTPDWTASLTTNDPYEMRLDADAARTAPVGTTSEATADSPFTPAEMERVLRQFDADAAVLPQRLATALDGRAEQSRMLITTDSWDTTTLTGDVAERIVAYARTLKNPYSVLSPDLMAGLRFDVNRPFLDEDKDGDEVLDSGEDTNGNGRLETLDSSTLDYCKHLYTLLVALGQPADEKTAQWAVNAASYRSPGSTMIRFAYDTNLTDADGWNPSGNDVVWGAVRPELLLAQTLDWYSSSSSSGGGGDDDDRDVRGEDDDDDDGSSSSIKSGGLYITLYRPQTARGIMSGTTFAINPLSTDLGANDLLDLRKKAAADPLWRLRVDGTQVVRFDDLGSTVPANTFGSATAAQNAATQMAPDSYLCLQPATTGAGVTINPSLKTFTIDKGGDFRLSTTTESTVFLERLANPRKPYNAVTNPYRTVDELKVLPVNRTNASANNWKSFTRAQPVWKQPSAAQSISSPTLSKLPATLSTWFPWAGRPYVSQAEMALVPPGDASTILRSYETPQAKPASSAYNVYYMPTEMLLDATTVPSRFAGSSIHVDRLRALADVGMDTIPWNQLSRWREPGRVNLNTVVSSTGCSDPRLDNAVWLTVLGSDADVATNPFLTSGEAAKSMQDLLTLTPVTSGSTAMYLDRTVTSGSNSSKKNRQYDLNPAFAYATATRLANVATVRSHVFGVWITLETTDTTAADQAPVYHRVFAIVDRSIPVGYNAGEPLNARDVIRLHRFLE